MKPSSIIAHRGASHFAPENTLPAFQLAYEMGAHAIETDIHLSKDGIPVLIHDETVARTTNGKGKVQDMTLRELQSLDAGSWFSQGFSGTSIMDLGTFLQWAKNKPLKLNLEMKNNKIDYPNLEEIAFDYVRDAGMLNRIIFSSFNMESVKRLGRYRNEVEIALLTSKRNKHLTSLAKELNVHALHIKHTLLDSRLTAACRAEQIRLRVYTVNKEAMMLRVFNEQCDLITDKPNVAIDCLKNHLY